MALTDKGLERIWVKLLNPTMATFMVLDLACRFIVERLSEVYDGDLDITMEALVE